MKRYLVLILLFFIGFTSYAQTSNDADAQAFILACDADPAGKLTPDQKNYITQMVEGMKSIGIWDGMKAVYPMVGNTGFKNKFNLKDPRDLDVAFRLTFPNGMGHSALGMQGNGTNQYANTNVTALLININNNSMWIYSNSQAQTGSIDMGFQSGSALQVSINFNGFGNASASFSGNPVSPVTVSNTTGFFGVNRISSTVYDIYARGSIISKQIQTSVAVSDLTRAIIIGARKQSGVSIDFPSNKRFGFASIGAGLTDNQAQQLSHLVSYLQGILNRQ
jgi:hypothetical protein